MQQVNTTLNVKAAPRPKVTTRPQLTTCRNSVQVAKTTRIINVKAEANLAWQIAAATIEVVPKEETETNEPFSISESTYALEILANMILTFLFSQSVPLGFEVLEALEDPFA